MKSCRNLSRKIHIADSQEDHIDKSGEGSESTSSILNQSDDSIQAFRFGVCYGFLDKGQNAMHMLSKHFDEIADRFEAAFQCRGAPMFDKPFCGPGGTILPEMFKLVLEDPGSMDSAIGDAKGIEDARVLFGSMGGVLEEQPAEPLEGFTFMV